MNDKNEMKRLIIEYISEDECDSMCDDEVFNCEECSCREECYMKSCERCNMEFAEMVGYGGYNTIDEFWEQI